MDAEYQDERCIRRKWERQWKSRDCDVARDRYIRQRDYCITLANSKQRDFYFNLLATSNNQSLLFKHVSKL